MTVLVDTSVLGRLPNRVDPANPVASNAIAVLHRRGEILKICPQNLIEFRNFATRPVAANGLGMSTAQAESLGAAFETAFPLLPEGPDIFAVWKSIATGFSVMGKQVHDARLVAICHVNGIRQLLTFNVAHFSRFASFGPGLVVIDPRRI